MTRRVYFDLDLMGNGGGHSIRACVAEVTPDRRATDGLRVELVSADIDYDDLDDFERVARDEYRENFR